MEQVIYVSATYAFALIAAMAIAERRAARNHRKSSVGKADADGRVWTIIDREFIEE